MSYKDFSIPPRIREGGLMVRAPVTFIAAGLGRCPPGVPAATFGAAAPTCPAPSCWMVPKRPRLAAALGTSPPCRSIRDNLTIPPQHIACQRNMCTISRRTERWNRTELLFVTATRRAANTREMRCRTRVWLRSRLRHYLRGGASILPLSTHIQQSSGFCTT